VGATTTRRPQIGQIGVPSMTQLGKDLKDISEEDAAASMSVRDVKVGVQARRIKLNPCHANAWCWWHAWRERHTAGGEEWKERQHEPHYHLSHCQSRLSPTEQPLHLQPALPLLNPQDVSYVSRRRMDAADFDPDAVDEEGLPLVYNEARISEFWSTRPGELVGRWTRFTAVSAPWLTKVANAVITGRVQERQVELARDAVSNLEKLGPTFIK
jgi:hypothetical protein